MGKIPLSKKEVENIKNLRQKGLSINEIKNISGRGYGTIFRYMKDVKILPKYEELWKKKRNGSKFKSARDWIDASNKSKEIIGDLDHTHKMIILSCLYWGEGNKKELNLINSDPQMVKVFIECLKDLDVKITDLKISLRLFKEIDIKEAENFWLNTLNLPKGSISSFDIIDGNKKSKLKYGMCRVRVRKSGKYFKLIISMIDLIKSRF